MVPYAVGVDLGTTFTAAAVARDVQVEMVSLAEGGIVVPSVVSLTDGGALVTGAVAEQLGRSDPQRVARNFKRRIGSDAPLMLAGAPLAAHVVMGRLLRWVVETITAREGAPPERVCVTHPANWSAFKLDYLHQAIGHAGVKGALTLSEPEAAAIHHASLERVPEGSLVAVYDLGGGTFDAAVLRKQGDGYEIVGEPQGIEFLGGLDFDDALFNIVSGHLEGTIDRLDPEDPMHAAALQALRDQVVDAKHALSTVPDVSIPVMLPGLTKQVRVTRAEFERAIGPAVGETVAALRRALDAAGVAASDLTKVLLVGGSSRVPLVSQVVRNELGIDVAVDTDPKNAVAKGAALHAAHTYAQEHGPPPGPNDEGRETEAPLATSAGEGWPWPRIGAVAAVLAVVGVLAFLLWPGDDPDAAAGATTATSAADGSETGGSDLPASTVDVAATGTPTTTSAAAAPPTTTGPPTAGELLGTMPSSGLVAAFFADEGVVTTADTSVASWTDLTGSITLEPEGAAPTLVVAGRNGRDIVRFGGGLGPALVGDAAGLPAGNTDRTLLVAGSWSTICCGAGDEILGAGWGDPITSNGSFFAGNVHFNCFSLSFVGVTTNPGSFGSACGGQINEALLSPDHSVMGAGFISMAAVIDRGDLKLYRRDLGVQTTEHVFETVPRQFWIGTWPTSGQSGAFDVVAVLVYDRALSDDEVASITGVLESEFGIDA